MIGVCEVQHLGGGVAPWNVGNYRWVRKNGNLITLIDKFSKKEFNIVFFIMKIFNIYQGIRLI